MWEKVKSFIEKSFPIALPTKLIVGALVGVLAGPGLLGFLSELATYRYSAAQGIRPPLEGIPYLRAAVTYGSFSMLMLGAALFYLSLYVAGKIAGGVMIWVERFRKIAPKGADTVLNRFRELKLKHVLGLSVVVAVAFAAFSYGLRYFQGEPQFAPATLVFAVYGAVATLLVWRKQIAWWLAVVVTFCGFAYSVAVMFNVDRYGGFLRFVGYGGGIPISVDLDHSIDGTTTVKGALVLRTTEALMLYDSKAGEIKEMPIKGVRAIRHLSKPLMSLPIELPSPHVEVVE